MQVEIIPHQVKTKTAFGEVVTRFDQDIVLVNGRECGYVGTQPGAKFLPLAGFPHQLQKEVDEAIAKHRKTDVVKSDPSPPVIDPKTGAPKQ